MKSTISKVERAIGKALNRPLPLKNGELVVRFLEAKRAKLATPPSPLLWDDDEE